MTKATCARLFALFAWLALASGARLSSAEDASPSADDAVPTPSADSESSTTDESPDASETERLDELERELAAVMDELVSARARAGLLARSLFRSALEIEVVRRADEQQLSRLTLRLDGVPVHDSDGSALASDRAQLFTGYVAPGMRELTFEHVERSRAGGTFGYTRSERYRIEVKKGQNTHVELVVRDDSDMAEEAAEHDDGEYQVDTEVRITYERARD
jgi:hypothetical protein